MASNVEPWCFLRCQTKAVEQIVELPVIHDDMMLMCNGQDRYIILQNVKTKLPTCNVDDIQPQTIINTNKQE